MKLVFTLRSLGKKRPFLEDIALDIDVSPTSSAQHLLEKIVEQQVAAFNSKKADATLIDFLSEETITDNAQSGSVKFNDQFNRDQADLTTAQATVLSAFEDGLIALFVNEEQVASVNEEINLNEGDTIQLIRLTFLAGRSW